MRPDFTISASDEPDRLMLVFEDRAFSDVFKLCTPNRVGGRRDATNETTHFVFPPEAEADVRRRVQDILDQAAAQVALAAAHAAKAEAYRVKWEAAAAKKAAKAAKPPPQALRAVEDVRHVSMANGVLRMPYASGAPSILRAAGADWYRPSKTWRYPDAAASAIRELLPKLDAAADAQIKRDANPRRKRQMPNSSALFYDADDWDLENAADCGLMSTKYMGRPADEIRNMMYRSGEYE